MLALYSLVPENKMIIKGPFSIQKIENEDTSATEMHIKFTDEYKQLDQQGQSQMIDQHISELEKLVAATENDSADYQGMVIMLQFSKDIKPELDNGNIPLEETIVFDIEHASPIAAFLDKSLLH